MICFTGKFQNNVRYNFDKFVSNEINDCGVPQDKGCHHSCRQLLLYSFINQNSCFPENKACGQGIQINLGYYLDNVFLKPKIILLESIFDKMYRLSIKHVFADIFGVIIQCE